MSRSPRRPPGKQASQHASANRRRPPRSRTGRASAPKYLASFLGMAVLAGLLAAGIAMPMVGGAGALTQTAITSFESYPTALKEPTLPQRSVIRNANGERIAWVYDQNRVIVPIKKISPFVQKAIVAIEDNRFYEHGGVDVKGTLRALATNTASGDIQQGGSTITQQYVKMILLNSAKSEAAQNAATERTPQRKLREARYAIALEKQSTKKEILEGYLNIAYFGSGAYGIQTAAETYFNKTARNLNLVESATLAGAVQQPGAFDPYRNPKDSKKRRDEVLTAMHTQGDITQGQLNKALKIPVKSYVRFREFDNGCSSSDEPYFCDYALNYIRNEAAFGKERKDRIRVLENGGLDITLNLDPGDQAASHRAVQNYVPIGDLSQKIGAITMVEPGTGKVVAMAQNTRWGLEKKVGETAFNYNVRKKYGGILGVQAGSTFKVFTLSAALERGISPYTSIKSPGKTTFYGFRDCDGYNFPPYPVANASESHSGTFNMFSGTKGSVNTFFIGLERMVDLCRQAEIAGEMGVRHGDGSKLNAVPSFPLGSNEVVPVDMAAAYATFPNDGVACRPNPIASINDVSTGKPIYRFTPDCERVLSSRVADTIVAMLRGPVSGGGTAPGAGFGRPIGGKTGTNDRSTTAAFAGFTPQRAAYVSVFDPRGGFRFPLRYQWIGGRYYSEVMGATLPMPIWRQAMSGAHADLPYANFGAEPKHINDEAKRRARQKKQREQAGAAGTPNPAPAAPQSTPPQSTGESPLSRLRDFDFDFGN